MTMTKRSMKKMLSMTRRCKTTISPPTMQKAVNQEQKTKTAAVESIASRLPEASTSHSDLTFQL